MLSCVGHIYFSGTREFVPMSMPVRSVLEKVSNRIIAVLGTYNCLQSSLMVDLECS